MKAHELVNATFEHPSIDIAKIHKWSVTKVDDRTDYVYVERVEGDGKLGQWIPGEWVLEFMEPKRLRLKIDSLRKSRDYFKNERDELNRRLGVLMVRKNTEEKALIDEIEFVKMELLILERDVRFWKSFALYASVSAFILLVALAFCRYISC
jgi:hypothetical protein